MSPKNSTPPAVGVMPPINGNGALNCQLRLPLSASVPVIHPAQSLGSSVLPKPSGEPLQGSPMAAFAIASAAAACAGTDQATSPVKIRFKVGSYAGLFHSAPPCEPGQKRVPAAVIGASVLSMRVIGRL